MNSTSRTWLWALVIVVIIAIIVLLLVLAAGGTSSLRPTTTATMQTVQASYTCDGGKTINATYLNATTSTTTGNSVILTLSDRRQMTLQQTISADGGRYANADENFVFWSKGNGAFVQEGNETTFSNCVAKSGY